MFNDPDLANLEIAVAGDPANGAARQDLAKALLGAGNAPGALAHARILLTSTPQDPAVLGLAAMAADLSGDPVAARSFGATLRSVQASGPESEQASLSERDVSSGGVRRSRMLGTGQSISLLRISDVVGMAEERRRINDMVIAPWAHTMRQRSGTANGVLLYGPPSAGKRFLGETVAGELGMAFTEVDMAEMVDPWGVAGASRLSEAFATANESGPSVVLLANLEVATHRRLRYTANGRKVLTDLLAALDRRNGANVFVIATSSAPWLVQPILRTPGRFSEALLVGPPDHRARCYLITKSLQRRGVAHEINPDLVAANLQGCTIADIESVIDGAIARAYNDSATLGRLVRVQSAHVDSAAQSYVRGAHTWFDTAYNFPEFTDDSSQFDPLFDYIRRHVRRS